MHPIYDAHGKKGRQILLPFDKEENRPRRLAWAHTLCCLTLNKSNEAASAFFGCAPDGWYGQDEDESSLLDDDSVNSDLDVEGTPSGIHHFVFWGYLHQFFGVELDDWAKP